LTLSYVAKVVDAHALHSPFQPVAFPPRRSHAPHSQRARPVLGDIADVQQICLRSLTTVSMLVSSPLDRSRLSNPTRPSSPTTSPSHSFTAAISLLRPLGADLVEKDQPFASAAELSLVRARRREGKGKREGGSICKAHLERNGESLHSRSFALRKLDPEYSDTSLM
jgi:hypothetical protein